MRYFWTTTKALFMEENVTQKFAVLLGRPTLLLFVRCARSSFSLDLLAGYTASTIWLTPRPTIRVLVALETGAVTEPGYTAPSLLG